MNAPDKRTLEVLLDHNIEMLEKEESPHMQGYFSGKIDLLESILKYFYQED